VAAIPNLNIERKCGKVLGIHGTNPITPKPDATFSRALVNLARQAEAEQ
jgi:hypothetical protein